jgi:hypothetical protein
VSLGLPDLSPAAWCAFGAGIAALVLVAYAGWRTWQAWTRLSFTREAASALVELHQARLDTSLMTASDHIGTMADGGEQLADALGELRADATHLAWMLKRVPEERARLREELLELVLPSRATGTSGDD